MASMSQPPKSAIELAMERLKAADREGGVEETPLSEAQKARIAEIRRVRSSRLAEREILHLDALRKALDAEARTKLEEEYRIDRQRIEADGEQAIERVRKGG